MSETRAVDIAETLGIDLVQPTVKSVSKAIRRELRELQADDLSTVQAERRRLLTKALTGLRRRADRGSMSTDLVSLASVSIGELARVLATVPAPKPSTEERMRAGARVAATQARKDFRNSRTLPIAGLGAFVVFIWAQRESLGVDLSGLGVPGAAIVGSTLLVAAYLYLLIWSKQRLDERTLRRLYLPEVQAAALAECVSRGPLGTAKFTATLDAVARDHAFRGRVRARGYRHGMTVHRYPRVLDTLVLGPRRGLSRSLDVFSTVDLESAAWDAAELALERFVLLGAIEPVESWSGLDYRMTEKYGDSIH